MSWALKTSLAERTLAAFFKTPFHFFLNASSPSPADNPREIMFADFIKFWHQTTAVV